MHELKCDRSYFEYLFAEGENMQCALCNKTSFNLHLVPIQLAGKFEDMYICPECKAKRDRELEMCRENYRRMTEVKVER